MKIQEICLMSDAFCVNSQPLRGPEHGLHLPTAQLLLGFCVFLWSVKKWTEEKKGWNMIFRTNTWFYDCTLFPQQHNQQTVKTSQRNREWGPHLLSRGQQLHVCVGEGLWSRSMNSNPPPACHISPVASPWCHHLVFHVQHLAIDLQLRPRGKYIGRFDIQTTLMDFKKDGKRRQFYWLQHPRQILGFCLWGCRVATHWERRRKYKKSSSF